MFMMVVQLEGHPLPKARHKWSWLPSGHTRKYQLQVAICNNSYVNLLDGIANGFRIMYIYIYIYIYIYTVYIVLFLSSIDALT